MAITRENGSMPKELKACPACGGERIQLNEYESLTGGWDVFCKAIMCGAHTRRARTKQDAIDLWDASETKDLLFPKENTSKKQYEEVHLGHVVVGEGIVYNVSEFYELL